MKSGTALLQTFDLEKNLVISVYSCKGESGEKTLNVVSKLHVYSKNNTNHVS